MTRMILIQPGSTDFDEQGRIKGALDLPMSAVGDAQATQLANDLHFVDIDAIYAAPCQSAYETALRIAADRRVKIKTLSALRNLDLGLWHGKRIAEIRHCQPRVFRQCQESPESVVPPDGESVAIAKARAQQMLARLIKRHPDGNSFALVTPNPMAAIVRCTLQQQSFADFWNAQSDCGQWETLKLANDPVPAVVS